MTVSPNTATATPVAATVPSSSLSINDVFWWLCDEPTNPMVITALFYSHELWTAESVKTHLWPNIKDNVRMLGVPEKKRGLWWSWSPVPDFKLDDHVRPHILPAPTDECLTEFLNEEISTQLPRHRPLWKIIVLHNVPNYKSAFMLRIHHVIADGTSLASWLASLSPDMPSAQDLLAAHLANANANASPRANATHGGFQVNKPRRHGALRVLNPMFWVEKTLRAVDKMLFGVVVNAWTVVKTLLMPKDSNSPFKGPASGRYITATTLNLLKLPLSQLKEVGKRIDPTITVNDVLCALMAGSFRRYFSDYCHLHPEEMAMRVTIPINTRHPLEPIKLENRFSLVFKTLPVHKATVQERIGSFHVRMGILKRSAEPIVAMLIMGLLTFLPTKIFRMVLQRYTRRSSAVMTNVPGAPVPLRFFGATIQDVVFFVPQSGDVGMGVSFVSYRNFVNIGLIVDRLRVSDLKPLLKYVSEEWEQMLSELSQISPIPSVASQTGGLPLPVDAMVASDSKDMVQGVDGQPIHIPRVTKASTMLTMIGFKDTR